jgi:hypothetical protein
MSVREGKADSFGISHPPVEGRENHLLKIRNKKRYSDRAAHAKEHWSGMRSGWGRDDGAFSFSCPGRSAARVLRAGVRSTLHGVVFAIFCPGPAVHRRRGAMPGSGHEIVSVSRLRDESIQLHHIILQGGLLALPSAGFTRIRNWPLPVRLSSGRPRLWWQSMYTGPVWPIPRKARGKRVPRLPRSAIAKTISFSRL